jgi:NADH-quinone oxidoreductase subunit A
MLDNYLPVLLFVLIGLAFGVVPFALGRLLGPNHPDGEKLSAYECGFSAFEDARMKFDVRYYLIAILFILFDLEIAFLFPWATVFQEFIAAGAVAWFVFGSVMVFLAVLVIGYVVEWKNGALDWE